ncbi:hypothetical protein [Chitinophaga sp. Cy-1792]|uniref:hypothetical protein n=1 Tax=Chitinophaga sp. Cy-1792 TaxID=2608339 RepID=UPI001420F427|nr:hypothetical protein [Chitinophaga sp. Cy-1792]NIG55787.1 hypothetical protein [Chitinophaga sp. Cy-1792]
MILLRGKLTAHIHNATNHDHVCENCGDADLDVNVFREYTHLFFLPLFPSSYKDVKIQCNTCGEKKFIGHLQQQYEKSTRTPLYLYTGLILAISLISLPFIIALFQ